MSLLLIFIGDEDSNLDFMGECLSGENTQPSLICLLVEDWHRNGHCLPGSYSWGQIMQIANKRCT